LDELKRRKLPCQHQVQIGQFEVDILVGRKIAVEVDGYYHALKGKVSLDASKDKHLESLGYVMLRIDGTAVKNRRLLREFGARVQRCYEEELTRERSDQDAPLTKGVPIEELQQLKAELETEEEKRKHEQKKPQTKRPKELSDEELFLQAIDDLTRKTK